jgi:bifunctional non-homologous end joining protein LigD
LAAPTGVDRDVFRASAASRAVPSGFPGLGRREWTESGKLRQASFRGLREDKRPQEVVREAPGLDVI